MKFRYEGRNRAARIVKGEFEANDATDAKNRLRDLAIRPLKLVAIGGGQDEEKSPPKPRGPKSESDEFSFDDLNALFQSPRPKLTEFTTFIRQLATMQGAGIPLVQSLGMLSEQVENRAFGGVLASIKGHIEEGLNFSDSLKKYPEVFDNIFINLVQAGEMSGSMEAILQRLSIYYEKAAALKRKIQSAMTYPVATLAIVFLVLIAMLLFVVPQFEEMFKANNKALPAATQVIVDVSNIVQEQFILIIIGVGAGIIGAIFAFKNPETKRIIDPILLKVPVFGTLIQKASIARFSRTLSTMIQAGVPFLESLEITSRVCGNTVIEDAVMAARLSVTEGNSIADPLEKSGVFPPMVVGMVTVGEQTGALESMLNKVAEFYEDEVDNTVTALSSILEPMMILIVGLIVAGFLIPLYLPVFNIGDLVGG